MHLTTFIKEKNSDSTKRLKNYDIQKHQEEANWFKSPKYGYNLTLSTFYTIS